MQAGAGNFSYGEKEILHSNADIKESKVINDNLIKCKI